MWYPSASDQKAIIRLGSAQSKVTWKVGPMGSSRAGVRSGGLSHRPPTHAGTRRSAPAHAEAHRPAPLPPVVRGQAVGQARDDLVDHGGDLRPGIAGDRD